MDKIYDLVKFAKNTRYEDIPADVIEGAKILLKDAIAVAVAGTGAEGVDSALKVVRKWGGAPESSVLVFGDKLPAPHAAFVNSVMTHARDYDEVQLDAIVHTEISVVPTILAIAESLGNISGKELLRTIVVTEDIFIRIGYAIKAQSTDNGWIYSSTVGYLASTVAAGVLMGLSEEEIVNAVGISYAQTGGNHQAARDTSLTKRMQPAFAARTAVFSACLAKEGVTGAHNVLEGKFGFFNVYIHGDADPEELTKNLGKEFYIRHLSFKKNPICGPCLSPTTAMENLVAKYQIRPEEITGIDVGTNEHGVIACAQPKEVKFNPQKPVEAQFSIPYAVCKTASKGTIGLADMTEAGLDDDVMRSLLNKVNVYMDEEIEKNFGRGVSPAKVTVHTTRGDFYDCPFPKGHPQNPLNADDMRQKFYDCMNFGVYKVKDGAEDTILQLIDHLENESDAGRKIVQTVNDAFIRP